MTDYTSLKIGKLIHTDRFNSSWKEVNLTSEFSRLFNGKKPFNWLNSIESKYRGNVYGGFLEDRSPLFDSRHVKTSPVHLGVDFWASENTMVKFPYNDAISSKEPELLNIHRGTSIGGWGGRKDYKYADYVYIFAHLDTTRLTDSVSCVGILGNRTTNGGWLPHLHMQVMTYSYYIRTSGSTTFDAYAEYNSPAIAQHINPISVL